MTRSINRQANKIAGRKMLKMVSHIERLGAAFCHQTGLNPEEIVMLSEPLPEGKFKYWYEKRSEHKTDEEARYMFDLLRAISEVKDPAQLGQIVADVRTFINLYKEVANVDTEISEKEVDTTSAAQE